MTPPIWVDAEGRPRPVRPCPRCGREAPVFEFSLEQLRLLGWRAYKVASFVNWCGHLQEFIPIPEAEGGCWMIPVLGETDVRAGGPSEKATPRERIGIA